MRRYIVAFGLLGSLFSASAQAVITVNTALVATASGARAQAVITDPTGLGGSIEAIAIREIRSAIFIIDSLVPKFNEIDGVNPLTVSKRMLTTAETYGQGLPFGEPLPPTTDPTGPWFGLVWPYRDQYDYFPNLGDPLGDDVGTAFVIEPNVYGFVDVDGIARGGPTDPTPAGGSINRLLRGITGNGLNGPATYFALDITPNFGDPEREVTIRIISSTAKVVVQDKAGNFSEIVVNVPGFETTIRLPEPAAASSLLLLAAFLTRRRARRE